MNGLVCVLFAGGGGSSHGIRMATGRDPDIAINHDAKAIAMHEANHPGTKHFRRDVWDVAPREAVGSHKVDVLWASPTCVHFSRAKGGPLDRRTAVRTRSLAWIAVRWAREVRPRIIFLENVEAFQQWGPLLNNGRPCQIRKGLTFRRWVKQLESEGYRVEWRELRACDYGAPTSRNRLFVIARCDGEPIVWPTPTHGRGRFPYRTAAECIDWSIPCPSIFDRKKPLTEATLRRIARGLRRFVLEHDDPFVVPNVHLSYSPKTPFVAPTLIQQSYGERLGQAPRSLDINQPLGTVVAGGVKHAIVTAWLAKNFGGHEGPGQSLQLPLGTVTCRDHHALVTARSEGNRRDDVRAFILRYNGDAIGQPLQLPLQTITTARRFGLVIVRGESYEIADIGMRLLTPRELFRAQSFPDSYDIAPTVNGKPLSKTAQIRMAGNSVPPAIAAAIVRANLNRDEAVAA